MIARAYRTGEQPVWAFRRAGQGGLVLLPALWLGLLLGVSVLATLAKFRAGSITLPIALDIGRATFRMLESVEFGLLAAVLLLALMAGAKAERFAALAALTCLRAVQSLWLLPPLFANVEAYLAGRMPEPGASHQLYALCEGLKMLVLAALALREFDRARTAGKTEFNDRSPPPSG